MEPNYASLLKQTRVVSSTKPRGTVLEPSSVNMLKACEDCELSEREVVDFKSTTIEVS